MEETNLDLSSVIGILLRRRRLVGVITLSAILLALAYIFSATPIYRATTLLMVDSRGSNLLESSDGRVEQAAVLNSRVDSEVEILRSDATALAVVEAADLISDPHFRPTLGWIEKFGVVVGVENLGDRLRSIAGLAPKSRKFGNDLVRASLGKFRQSVEIRRRVPTYLIEVSVLMDDPKRAAEIANTYAGVYLQRQVAAKTSATIEASSVIRRQAEAARVELAVTEAAVNNYIEDNLARIESDTNDADIGNLRRQLEAIQADITNNQSALASAEAAFRSGDWANVAGSLADDALIELERQREALNNRLGEVADGSAASIDLASRLNDLQQQISTTSQNRLDNVRRSLESSRARENETRAQLQSVLMTAKLSPAILTELYELQQSATIARTQYQTLLSREQEFGTQQNLQIADARVVSEALAPSNPVAPKKTMILALSLVLGIGFGVTAALIKEYYLGGIVSAVQLRNVVATEVPVSLPKIETPKSGNPADTIIHAAMSAYAEAYRKLRATMDRNLEKIQNTDGGNVILVTSALPAEGKTTAAIAIARTYAQAGKKTLLIDADLRKPAIGTRMGIESEVGIYEFLEAAQNNQTKDPTLADDPLSNLSVLTTNRKFMVPTDGLINSDVIRNLISLARENFEVVIIDTPPLLPLVDTRYMLGHVDTVVHVVRFGTATQAEVREASAILREWMRPETPYYGILSQEEAGSTGYSYYKGYTYYGED